MAEGRVLYADHDHVHVLRYVGDIRHPLAPSVSGFVDKLLEHLDGKNHALSKAWIQTQSLTKSKNGSSCLRAT
jgi:hypothetical protein